MKNLFLLRGLPGCGKSTWIKKNELEPYTLSSDKLREMFGGLEYNLEGNLTISSKRDKLVWETLFNMLEARMQRGLTTIIDATNIKEASMNKYKALADKYFYRVYVVDFTGIPIEVCIERNKNRGYKKVPEKVIYSMADSLKTAKIPDGIKVISLYEFIDIIHAIDVEISTENYDRIMFIGDIHGCLNTLKEIFKEGIDERTLYVFTGDYIDRGPYSVETLLWLSQFVNRKNFIFLEGNHERWIRDWLTDNINDIRSKEFKEITSKQFDDYFSYEGNKRDKDFLRIVNFASSLREFALIKINSFSIKGKVAEMLGLNVQKEKYIFACHGGVPYINPTVGLMSSSDIIKGVGRYQDCVDVDNEFDKNLGNELYQVHGHRNFYNSPIRVNYSVFNLEGNVERGGALRTVTFRLNNGILVDIETKEFKNKEDII